MNLTPEQWADMRADIIKETAMKIANDWRDSVLRELGCYLGEKAAIPVSLAIRFSGFNDKWIRRNIPIIKAEGQADAIEIKDLKDAMERRKDK